MGLVPVRWRGNCIPICEQTEARAARPARCPAPLARTTQYRVTGSSTPFSSWDAALLSDKQAGDLALNPRRNDQLTRLGQCLRPRRDVRHIAENLAGRIQHRRAGVDGDQCGQRGLAGGFVLAVQLRQRALDR
jgi:hypothetical protein